MDLDPMVRLCWGPSSEMAMLLLFSDTGPLPLLLFR